VRRFLLSSNKNFAIFGGSFDPIHNAHVIIAQKMYEFLRPLKKLYIIPAGCSPFKMAEEKAPFELRAEWCKSAFSAINGIKILEIEKNTGTEKPSYTIDTLNTFFKLFGEYPTIIIGEDSLQTFHKWKSSDEIIAKTSLAVYKRRGCSEISETEKKYPDRVRLFDTSYIEISSTEIRERIAAGKTVRGFVPQSVEKEIIYYYSGT
jgi:nicotinate-nucleotide adenylyltransferase